MSLDLVYRAEIVVQNGAKRADSSGAIREAIEELGSAYEAVSVVCCGTWEEHCSGDAHPAPELSED